MSKARCQQLLVRWSTCGAMTAWLATWAAPVVVATEPVKTSQAATSPSGLASQAQSVAIQAGRASFDLPGDPSASPTLIIVSALTTTPGPLPVQIQAQPADGPAQPVVTAPRPAIRLPQLNLPPLVAAPARATRLPPSNRTFTLMTQAGLATVATNYRAVPSRLRAVGQRVQVYVDAADEAAVDDATLRDLVETFDRHVWPSVAARFGPATDVDDDGRFTILLSRWLNRLSDGTVRVDGFVRGADLDRRQPAPFSNRCDMMYLNASMKAGPHLRTVLAHEYTHAVTFSRKVLSGDRSGPLDVASEEEGWLDEGLAHLIEDDLGFARSNLDYRISAYLSQPERYRLVVEDYLTADLFRSHGNRGATYLFLRWCVDRYGPNLLDALIRSPKRGIANLEAATGTPFAELFRRWTIAVACSGLDPSSPEPGMYRSMNLRGELDDWILAGPRTASVRVGGPTHSWTAEGTTAHFVLVDRSATGATRVTIAGPADADLQVTLIPLPAGLGRPELVIRPATNLDGSIQFQARFREAGGTPIRLGVLAWERLVPVADLHAPGFRHAGLDMLGINAAFGSSRLPAQGTLRSRPIALTGVKSTDGPLVFKAVGVDALGRRVVAWADLEPSSQSTALAWDDDPL